MQQPLRWYGGKHYLAKKIIAMMPPHTQYVEPYFGGGSVLLEKDCIGVGEVVNDIHGELMNFWRCLQDERLFEKFLRRVEATPFSQVSFGNASSLDNAVKFFIRCRQSRAGNMKDFATITKRRTRRGMSEQTSAWLTAIEGLPEVHARLKRVVILNQDALKVIKTLDRPDTVFYLDPPYLHETRTTTNNYQYEMSYRQHEELLDLLDCCNGYILLSGYPNTLYDSHLKGWTRTEFAIDNKMSVSKTKRTMTEVVWRNF